MVKIDSKNRLSISEIESYNEIDGFKVIEELLLHKGVEVAGATKSIKNDKLLLDMALVVYGLKSNSNNKLYVGLQLDKFFLKNDLRTWSGSVKVPTEIYERVKNINDKYKKQ